MTRPNYGAVGPVAYRLTVHPDAPPAVIHQLVGETMGTTWSVSLVAPPAQPLAPLRHAIQQALDTVVAQMSTWLPESDLCRFNRQPAGSWVALPAAFFTVLTYAKQVAQETGGACDPTIGPLVDIWGFGPHPPGTSTCRIRPAEADIQTARARVGWHRLQLDATQQHVLQAGGISLDLSGIAKGFGVDHAAAALQAQGIRHFLLEVGGELLGQGLRPDGQAWRIAIAQPGTLPTQAVPVPHPAPQLKQVSRVVALRDLAIATSGDDWHAFEQDGRRYSHTLDARTGRPVAHDLASVTVLRPTCMEADALATALTVMGPEQGFAYAQRHGIAALFIRRQADHLEECCSDAFAALVPEA